MKSSISSGFRKLLHQGVRKAFSFFPRRIRFRVYRSFIDCDLAPDARLVLKIADTQEELEACFTLLHDAYVGAGFMQPHPSGMRVTIYHALPTTTTLCAKFDGRVVGTLSLIRQSSFGFPMQTAFDLRAVQAQGGKIVEVSALAVHPDFRKSGGAILFPLMKFMYHYCTSFFDTCHVVIAVNPDRIEMYESLLLFERLPGNTIENYDFANGAPAVGASVNLLATYERLQKLYEGKPRRKNLHYYFMRLKMPNIQLPKRRYFTTNDPVMTPALLDYFFNQRTQVFQSLSEREKIRLNVIYDLPGYQPVLPELASVARHKASLRWHRRYSLKCRGHLQIMVEGRMREIKLQLVELSENGFRAHAKVPLPTNVWGDVRIQLGSEERSFVKAVALRGTGFGIYRSYAFKLVEADVAWRKLTSALKSGATHGDLDNASHFLAQEDHRPTLPGEWRAYLEEAWCDTDSLETACWQDAAKPQLAAGFTESG